MPSEKNERWTAKNRVAESESRQLNAEAGIGLGQKKPNAEDHHRQEEEVGRAAERRGLIEHPFFPGVFVSKSENIEFGKFPQKFYIGQTTSSKGSEEPVFWQHVIPITDAKILEETLAKIEILRARARKSLYIDDYAQSDLYRYVGLVARRRANRPRRNRRKRQP
jgi:hypothetical protein